MRDTGPGTHVYLEIHRATGFQADAYRRDRETGQHKHIGSPESASPSLPAGFTYCVRVDSRESREGGVVLSGVIASQMANKAVFSSKFSGQNIAIFM